MSTGRFSGLGSIRTNAGGIFFLQGNYIVELMKHKLVAARKGYDCFIIPGKVIESDNPERKPGTVASQVIALKPEYLETALGDIKQHVGALLGISDPDGYVPEDGQDVNLFWEEQIEYLLSDESEVGGTQIHLNVTNVTTKAGGVFGKHVWGPLYEPVN